MASWQFLNEIVSTQVALSAKSESPETVTCPCTKEPKSTKKNPRNRTNMIQKLYKPLIHKLKYTKLGGRIQKMNIIQTIYSHLI